MEREVSEVDNKGIISGKAVVYGGKAKKSADDTTLRDKRFHVDIDKKSLTEEEKNFLIQENAEWNKYEYEKEHESENKIKELEKKIAEKNKNILEVKKNNIPKDIHYEIGRASCRERV